MELLLHNILLSLRLTWYTLPEDGEVLPKDVAVNKNITVMYIRRAYVGFINKFTFGAHFQKINVLHKFNIYIFLF